MLNDWQSASEIIDVGTAMFAQKEDAAMECYFRLSSAIVCFASFW